MKRTFIVFGIIYLSFLVLWGSAAWLLIRHQGLQQAQTREEVWRHHYELKIAALQAKREALEAAISELENSGTSGAHPRIEHLQSQIIGLDSEIATVKQEQDAGYANSGELSGRQVMRMALGARVAIIFLAGAVIFLLWLIIPAFVYTDARRLGLPAGLWALLVFLSSVIGLVVYLIIRPRRGMRCNACGAPLENEYIACPQCGKELQAKCPECGHVTSHEWKVCPYCKHPLGSEAGIPPGLSETGVQ